MMKKNGQKLQSAKKTCTTKKKKIKQNLATACRISAGLDIWTKKGLTASFLGVTACYFNPEDNKAENKLLNLKEMVHPHNAKLISTLV